jgi:hypothetical protein
MKYNFCTLFDSYYLTRGIALYRSLELHCADFQLFIFAFDDKCWEILEKSDLRYAVIIPLSEFENDNLLRVKPSRTIAEYCWTCTASTIWYAIDKYKLDHCTYLDADMLFFSSPEPVFKEIGSSSIGITPHNFSRHLKSSEIYGKFCVQFTFFRNDADGLKALRWWKDSCIEWCFAKMEDGKYGDQKYLDYFEEKFEKVHIILDRGAGLAPWNISDYSTEFSDKITLISLKNDTGEKNPLIFYHYQGLKFQEKKDKVICKPSLLKIPVSALKFIYEPYINQLITIKNQLDGIYPEVKQVLFIRSLSESVGIFLRNKIRGIKLIRFIHYTLKQSRYNQPKNIGGVLK